MDIETKIKELKNEIREREAKLTTLEAALAVLGNGNGSAQSDQDVKTQNVLQGIIDKFHTRKQKMQAQRGNYRRGENHPNAGGVKYQLSDRYKGMTQTQAVLDFMTAHPRKAVQIDILAQAVWGVRPQRYSPFYNSIVEAVRRTEGVEFRNGVVCIAG